MTEPRRWAAVPVIELSSWLGSEDTHWMTSDLGGGLHIGTGPKPETCSICRDGCDWSDDSGDCGAPPDVMLTGHIVTSTAATLFEPASEESEPVTLPLCAKHAERVQTEPVAVEPR